MGLFDYLYGVDDALDEGRSLDAKREALVIPQYQPGGVSYEKIKASQGAEAADTANKIVALDFLHGKADALDAKGQAIYDSTHQSDSGIGDLLKRFFVIGLIGGAVYLFVKFGGTGAVKKFTEKYKWGPYALIGGGVLVAFLSWRYLKSTADSAKNVGEQFSKNLKVL